MKMITKAAIFGGVLTFLVPMMALAAEASGNSHATAFPLVFFFLSIMLLFARFGALAERFGQPAVLGELVMGILLGALALAPGFGWIELLKGNLFIKDVAEIGVILLLFRVGLESNVQQMKAVGAKAFLVACVGVALPFIGGYFASQALLPGLATNTYLFIGATLTATSVGITARVFSDLGFSRSKEAKIVLGAAVIDDVLGLVILAVVAAIVHSGTVSPTIVGWLVLKAVLFLAGTIVIGQLAAPRISVWLSRVHPGVGMKLALALLFCGAFAYGASALAGLAPIVGAFAAGLVLDPVHFKPFSAPLIVEKIRAWRGKVAGDVALAEEMDKTVRHEEEAHVESLIDGISHFFVPIFFVYTGMQVNLAVFTDLSIVGIGLAITVVAFAGKILCGYVAGKGVDRTIIGFGMIPRGEVGLIFANVGKQLGVVDDKIFAVIIIMVVLSTLLTPPILGVLIKRKNKATGIATPPVAVPAV